MRTCYLSSPRGVCVWGKGVSSLPFPVFRLSVAWHADILSHQGCWFARQVEYLAFCLPTSSVPRARRVPVGQSVCCLHVAFVWDAKVPALDSHYSLSVFSLKQLF